MSIKNFAFPLVALAFFLLLHGVIGLNWPFALLAAGLAIYIFT
jgi:hypothetical protein